MMKNFFITLILASVCLDVTMAQEKNESSGKIGGTIFGNYFYNVARDTGIASLKNAAYNGGKDVFGLAVQRALIFYEYKHDSKFSSRITFESDEKNFTVGNDSKASKFTVFLKDAWVKWQFHPYHAVVVGLQATPFEPMEKAWGNRFLEKAMIDLRGIVPTRDMGVGLMGQFDSTGIIKYHLLVANNSASKPEDNKYKRFYGEILISPFRNVAITVYSDLQTQASVLDTFVDKKVPNNILTHALAVSYNEKNKILAGVDAYTRIAQNAYNSGSDLQNITGMGVSVYGTYFFSQKVAAVLRYDYFEPSNKTSGDTRQLVIVACNIKPSERFTIAPNVVVETYENTPARSIAESVTARISFNWTF